MENKRGQGMSISTIIIIILAVIVLVFLIYGFTIGWNNLFDKISNFGGGQSNVQTVVQSCNIACTTNSQYDWCNQERELKFGSGDSRNGNMYSCQQLLTENVGLNDCPGINCPTPAGNSNSQGPPAPQ